MRITFDVEGEKVNIDMDFDPSEAEDFGHFIFEIAFGVFNGIIQEALRENHPESAQVVIGKYNELLEIYTKTAEKINGAAAKEEVVIPPSQFLRANEHGKSKG